MPDTRRLIGHPRAQFRTGGRRIRELESVSEDVRIQQESPSQVYKTRSPVQARQRTGDRPHRLGLYVSLGEASQIRETAKQWSCSQQEVLRADRERLIEVFCSGY